MKRWQEIDPEALNSLRKLLRESYPALLVYVKESIVFIRGPIDLTKDGKLLDSFTLEIELPKNYPTGVPIVRDIAGRFPRIADRHVYADGTLCLCVPDEYWRFYTPQSTIVDFLKTLVEPFLVAQIYYEKTGKMPFGERPHGWEGIVQFYGEILKTSDEKLIFRFIKCLCAPQIKGHWKCYCGSGLKLRNCHYQELFKMHQKIPNKVAKSSIRFVPSKLWFTK